MALNELVPEPARPISATATEVHTGPATDPLAWLATTPHTDERWYWEVPEDDTAWVGMGSAATVSTSGPGRFDEAAREADQLLSGLRVTGPPDAPLPRLAAGFAFDDTAQSGPWEPFGDGRLVLPAVQVLRRGDRTWVIRIDGHDRPTPMMVAPDPAGPIEVDAADWADEASRAHYRHLVELALEAIERGELVKAVPCRSLRLERRPDVARLLATLRSTYPACATVGVSIGTTSFVAATPERLVAVAGDRLHTAALAGSAPRHADPAIDAALGQGLLTSPKERSEHAVVVDAIDHALQRLGMVDHHPADPVLLRLHGIQHLHTPIDAQLPRGSGLFDVGGALHPTPAVAGHPGGRSAELRSTHEGMDRGWFASPVGWLDSSGDGEFRVALRSALITDVETTLYAGAGVVRGSDPSRELLETDVKLGALLGPVIATSDTR
jgi:isochorismate synthase